MANADIQLLFGVLGGGSISEGSGLEIKRDLDKILQAINSNPLKVKIALDTDTGGQRSWSSQLQSKLNSISTSGKFAVQISKLDIGSGAITDFKKQLDAVINTINLDKGTKITIESKGLSGEISSEFKKIGDASEDAARKLAAFEVQMESFNRKKSSLQELLTSADKNSTTAEERTRLAELMNQYDQWAVKIRTIHATKIAVSSEAQASLLAEGEAIRENIVALQKSINAERTASKAASAANKERMATLNEIISAYKKISNYINKNPRIAGTDEYTQLVSMRDELLATISATEDGVKSGNKTLSQTGDILSTMSKKDLRDVLTQFSQLDGSLAEAGRKGKTLGGIIESAYKKFGGWMIITRSLMSAVNGLRQMVTNVRELDAAMTELRKVTDATEATYNRFFNNAASRAKNLGATLVDTITATADFARLGYSISEAADLADAAIVYKNVGDGIEDISEASQSIISTMQAFGIAAEDAMQIVDRFNEVGNNFAISSQGIGEALLRSASSLAAGNNTLDESIALITTANTIVQNPERVGTTMKTISMYLRAAKTEAEEAGVSTEGMANSVSELRDEILALTGQKVDIQVDEDTFKSTYQIIKELSEVWDELTDISQANLLEMLGGKRNSNVVSALIENFSLAEEIVETSANAAGSALAENEKYLDSINGKIARFQAAFEALSSSVIDSGFIKGLVDFGTSFIEILTVITDKLGAMPALITAIAGAATVYSGAKNGGNSFGLLGLINGSIGYDPSGIRGTFAEFNRIVEQSEDIQAAFIKKIEAGDSTMAAYLKTVKGGNATLSGYKTYCKQAGVEATALGTSSKAAAIGVTVLNTALNMLISMGISLVIQGIITVISHLANATDEAVERTKALNDAYNEFKATNRENITTLESLKSEFEILSRGVSHYGENVALSADEYERYKEIVEQIVGISPSLSEGYSIENGYLADKNGLIERAIELQEQQYQQELRQMTTIENLKTGMEGYIATYEDMMFVDRGMSETDLNNSIWKLFRVNERDVTPDIETSLFDATGKNGSRGSIYLSEQILKALGVSDIESVMEKYVNDAGYYQFNLFLDDFMESIAQNYEKIAASIEYSEIGYKTKAEFDEAIGIVGDAATEYLTVQRQMEEANAGVANQLKLVAEANEDYAKLSDSAQSIVSNFINQFGVEDVYKENFFGNWVPDEEAINEVRVKITNFIESITPEIQSALDELFDIKGTFDADDLNVGEFKSRVEELLAELESLGFDDESIKYIRLSLETDMVEEQLNAVREAIDGLDGEYDDILSEMSSQDLILAYKIVAEEGSMTVDELLGEIERRIASEPYVAELAGLSQTISNLTSAYSALEAAEAEMAEGHGLSESTISSLLAVNENYLDYLYEENGVIKLNTEAWKENANAKVQDEMSQLEREISSLVEQNRLLQERNELLRSQPSSDTNTAEIEANTAAIAENTQKIQDNQGRLAIYSSLYGSITGDLSAYTNALNNFANIAVTIDSVASSYASLANLQKAVADGFTLSLDKILEYAKAYPEILNSATVTANGELALNEAVVNSFIAGKKAELDAQIDAEIAKLEADKAVLEAKKEFAEAQLELAKSVGEGEGQISKEVAEYRINAGNVIAEAMINNGIDEATAYKLAAAAMSQNIQEFSRIAYDVCKDVDGNFDQAAYNMAMAMYRNCGTMQTNLAAVANQAHQTAQAIAAAASGATAGTAAAVGGLIAGVTGAGIALNWTEGSFKGADYTYEPKQASLNDYISQLELDISDYENAISQINGQIAALEALKNTPFESFKNLVDNASSIVGEKTNDKIEQEQKEAEKAAEEAKKAEEEKKKLVEEYIAAIDEYYMALKRLEEVQKRRVSLEKKLEHTEDLSEKIFLSSGLIDVYKEEAEAERNLMAAKQATISANVGALRGLGFQVSYDPETNELYIKNLEHLNELTANSAGEYETLQEATNALRKETEDLIETTEQLNQDNIDAAENIEDLGYEILETKNNIIDYIEEIYDKQVESYQKIIELRKELIKSAKDEYDYEADIAEKVKEIADLQSRIDQLTLDDSRSAQAERASLMQELAEKQKDLADTQSDHATDSQLDALDKMAEDYEQQRADEIEIMRNTVTESEVLWNAFYQTILGNTATVGASVDEHIANAWIRAAQAVNDYSAAMSGISSGGVVINSIPKYHTGGVVDEANVGKDETLALLEKGEVVLNDGKQQTLYKIIDFQEELSKRLGTAIGSLVLPDITGNIRSLVGDAVSNITEGSQSLVFEPHIQVEINHSGTMNDTDAKSYGEKIADTAIEKLYSAFERRGISSTRASRLKP